MLSNRVFACTFAVGLLVAFPLAWAAGTMVGAESANRPQPSAEASTKTKSAAQLQQRNVEPVDLTMTRRAREQGLQPRSLMRSSVVNNEHLRIPAGALSERLIVKFKDGVEARAGRQPAHQVRSQAAVAGVGDFNAVLAQFGLSARQALTVPADRLRQLEDEAAMRSGRAQPDLAGIMYVEGPAAQLEQAAQIINALPIVEFVEFEGVLEPRGLTEEAFQLMAAEAPWAEPQHAMAEQVVDNLHRRPTPPPRPPSFEKSLGIDTGPRSACDVEQRIPARPAFRPVFSQVVGEKGAPWIRVHFRDVELSGSAQDGTASYIKITSLHDGDSQILDAAALKSWRNSSATFNGGLLQVELFAWPNTGENRLTIDRVTIGEWVGGSDLTTGVCDDQDNRELVFDTDENETCSGTACVTGRLYPDMCTAFVFRDDGDFQDNKLWLLTAGHCVTGGAPERVDFNVPLSHDDGTPMFPAAAHQHPLRPMVLFAKDQVMDPCGPGGCFRDWAMLKIDPEIGNPVDNFGLSDSDVYRFVATPPIADGQEILIRGYGNTMETPAPLEWNSVLKDAIGPLMTSEMFVGLNGAQTFVTDYRADSTGGDSGAPVTLLGPNGEVTNQLIAIHTCGGCMHVGGANLGTTVTIQDLVHARAAALNEDPEDPWLFDSGACCIEGTCFNNVTPEQCSDNNGFFAGLGTECGPYGCMVQACCLPWVGDDAEVCINTTEWGCRAFCGVILEFTFCDPDPENQPEPCDETPDCGEPTAGSCFFPNFTAGCNNEFLCEAVCEIDPGCCEEPDDDFDPDQALRFPGWDEICAWHARRLSPGGSLPGGVPLTEHVCYQTIGDCHSPNSTVGCDDPGCCLSVCMIDPLCCEAPFKWDSVCAQIANDICPVLDPAGPTPDLTSAQGYLTATSYVEDMEELTGYATLQPLIAAALLPDIIASDDENGTALERIPSSAAFSRPVIFPRYFTTLDGWGGEGFDLDGLYEFAESLDTGEENLTRGKGARIALLYPTAFVQPTNGTPETDNDQTHEDLRGRVFYPEVDQTQLIIPNSPSGFLNGHAGTAYLGIIGANPDNGIGMRGMSPDAELYFFPTVSAEQGGRLLNALSNAIEMFDAGDVIVIPFTPRVVQTTFASSAAANLLFAMATDLGISTVIAAGDYKGSPEVPMAPQAGEVDSGVTIVGAVTPGEPFHRAGFSQYCTATPCDPLEAIHIAGWGHAMATLGYGDLFMGETNGEPDVLRSYTAQFGGCAFNNPICGLIDSGTGAAAVQVAALTANIQGIPKMFYGMPMSVIQIRGELAGNARCQSGFCIGTVGPPGTGTEPSFYGDWDLGAEPKIVGSMIRFDPQSGFNILSIGVMADLPLTAEWLVMGGFFDGCDELLSVHTLRGDRVKGNLFSVCQTDGIDYTIRTEATNSGNSASFVPPGYEVPVSKVSYRASGQMSDLLVVGKSDSSLVSSYDVTATISPSNIQRIVGLELYDFEQGRWLFSNVLVLGPGEGGVFGTLPGSTFNPQRFFNGNNECLVRVWGFGFGTPPSPGGVPGEIKFDFNVDSVILSIESFGAEP